MHTPAVQAADAWNVQVGGDIPDDHIEANAFLPSSLSVHTGDTVTWNFRGFHTVTFTGGGSVPPTFGPGPDAGSVALGPAFFPAGPQGPGASYDGTQLVSSGTPQGDPMEAQPYALTFSKPGVYAYLCTIHPGMNGTVEVLPAGGALAETPAQAAARGQDQYNGLVASLRDEVKAIQSASGSSTGRAGVQTVTAGVGTGGGPGSAGIASLLSFINSTVTVRRGDLVAFTNADPAEIHTVTFTSGAMPPDFVNVQPQPAGPPMLSISANVAGPAGGGTYTGQGYVNSGILGPGQSFVLAFDAPAGVYDYLCVIHANMSGRIIVTE